MTKDTYTAQPPQPEPCAHIYKSVPIDGGNSASSPSKAVCMNCGFEPGSVPVAVSDAEDFETWAKSKDMIREHFGIRGEHSHLPLLREAFAAGRASAQPIANNEFDVRRILLDVVPGDDGMGQEIYAKNVADVERVLTEMGQRIEDYEGASQPAQPADAVGVIAYDDIQHGWHMQNLKPWDEIGVGTKLYAAPVESDAKLQKLIDALQMSKHIVLRNGTSEEFNQVCDALESVGVKP